MTSRRLRRGGTEVTVGIGVYESVVHIKEFRFWAWVGFLISNPTWDRLVIKKDKIRVEVSPSLPVVRVFLYGPYDSVDSVGAWEKTDAEAMRSNLVSLGNPLPSEKPLRELVLDTDEKAVLWVYLEDKYLDIVTAVVSLEVESADEYEV